MNVQDTFRTTLHFLWLRPITLLCHANMIGSHPPPDELPGGAYRPESHFVQCSAATYKHTH